MYYVVAEALANAAKHAQASVVHVDLETQDAIARLPPRQQEVILLRDVAGWDPGDVSTALELSDGNQRVLLHRARSKVRNEIEQYLEAA